jgi:hypothetical protein
MAPIATRDLTTDSKADLTDLKAKVVVNHVELDETPPPPVADNFMYDFKYNHPLPTIGGSAVDIPADCDAQKEAEAVVARLSEAMGNGDARSFANMFLDFGGFPSLVQTV